MQVRGAASRQKRGVFTNKNKHCLASIFLLVYNLRLQELQSVLYAALCITFKIEHFQDMVCNISINVENHLNSCQGLNIGQILPIHLPNCLEWRTESLYRH